MTAGKTSLTLKIQSTGELYGLGSGGPPSGNYQFNMTTASRGIFRWFQYTFLMGDATRDRIVNTLDFNVLASHFGMTGQSWNTGDFNYDHVVNERRAFRFVFKFDAYA